MSAVLSSPLPPLKPFRRALLRWYTVNRRDLPWRKTRDPYAIWVSEIMLQQTRVAAVLDKYRQFLERFPSVHDLASADLDRVLAAWSGLGYYRRARMMHQAARVVVRERGGVFPESAEGWRTLPGIGRYTAAAIASIAFAEPVAVVDGNVDRVVERVTGERLRGEALWRAAEALLDRASPGDWNQAMMELGAVICTPQQPDCAACPIRRWCRTRGEVGGRTQESRKRAELWYVLDTRDGSVRLVKRLRSERRMAGMWELPSVTTGDPAQVLYRLRHSITDTDYAVFVVPAVGRVAGRWVRLSRAEHLPLTGLARKILRRHFGAGFHP